MVISTNFSRNLLGTCLGVLSWVACVSIVAQPLDDNRPDTVGTGAFPAMKEEVGSLPDHVIYRPQNLAALGEQKLGMLVWGNGGCTDDGASSRFHLLEIASHGYLVIASGGIYSGPGARQPPEYPAPPADSQFPPPRTTPEQLTEAIDWAMAENQRQGSPYYGMIDADQIAVAGYSCGGLQVLNVAADPRIDTMVIMNSGQFNNFPDTLSGMNNSPDIIDAIHVPTLYILGGETDVAYGNGMDDFAKINHVPVAVANLPVGHGGTYDEDNGGKAAQVAVDWLQWQLRHDVEAASSFLGEDCGLCVDPQWSLDTKFHR